MKKEKADETSKMILLYFMEKKRHLKKEKAILEKEILELSKISKELTKEV